MESGLFKVLNLKLKIHLPPCYLNPPEEMRREGLLAGVQYKLNKMLMSYNDEVEGIVLAYWDVKLLENKGKILEEDPHVHFHISFQVLAFVAQIGIRLVGKVNQVGVDHIGLVSFGIVNASIPGSFIPKEYVRDLEKDCWNSTIDSSAKITDGELLQFTIVGINRTKHMISLVGSMLDSETGPVNALRLIGGESQYEGQKFERADNDYKPPPTEERMKKRKKISKQDSETVLLNRKSIIPEVNKNSKAATKTSTEDTKSITKKLKETKSNPKQLISQTTSTKKNLWPQRTNLSLSFLFTPVYFKISSLQESLCASSWNT